MSKQGYVVRTSGHTTGYTNKPLEMNFTTAKGQMVRVAGLGCASQMFLMLYSQIHIDVPRMNPEIPLFQQKIVQEVCSASFNVTITSFFFLSCFGT